MPLQICTIPGSGSAVRKGGEQPRAASGAAARRFRGSRVEDPGEMRELRGAER
jgi:hypothetical protein